jgi:hypothetical protein
MKAIAEALAQVTGGTAGTNNSDHPMPFPIDNDCDSVSSFEIFPDDSASQVRDEEDVPASPGPRMVRSPVRNTFCLKNDEDVPHVASIPSKKRLPASNSRDSSISIPTSPTKRRLDSKGTLINSAESLHCLETVCVRDHHESLEDLKPPTYTRSTSLQTLLQTGDVLADEIERVRHENDLLRKKIVEFWATYTSRLRT